MLKPNNYDNVRIQEYVPVKLGGHTMEILRIEEYRSKNDKPMIKVQFDFAPGDSQGGLFTERFALDTRPDKKWPAQGTMHIVVNDEVGDCSRVFKSFIKAVEDSNPGFEVNWVEGEEFANQFEFQKIGGVFGNVEEEYNGEILNRRKLRWTCSVDSAMNAAIPKDKKLKSCPILTLTFALRNVRIFL